MNAVDRLIEKGADRLEELAGKAAAEGGSKAKLAEELAEDAAFLRKLKPSLIAARVRGEATANEAPSSVPRVAPAAPQLGPRPEAEGGDEGPNPFVVVAAAVAVGIVLAKLIDWRGHAHPRR